MDIFPAKKPLFASIVEPHAQAIMANFMEAQLRFADLQK